MLPSPPLKPQANKAKFELHRVTKNNKKYFIPTLLSSTNKKSRDFMSIQRIENYYRARTTL